MFNEVFHITAQEANALASEYFIRVCGFDREGGKIRRMELEGMATKELISSKININAIASAYPKDVIRRGAVEIDGLTFTCEAFEKIDKGDVKSVYAYILTAGVYELEPEAPLMKQLYADLWGSAAASAGLDILKARLSGGLAYTTHGPGFDGMDIGRLENFFRLLDAGKIGVELRAGRFMVPLKSCAGLLISMENRKGPL